MSNSVIYVGIDVDDNAFHFTGYFPETSEILEQKSRPTLKSLMSKLEEIKNKFPHHSLKPATKQHISVIHYKEISLRTIMIV